MVRLSPARRSSGAIDSNEDDRVSSDVGRQALQRPRAPALPDVGVVGLVPDPFDVPWMPRHHVMTRLSRYFHVAWVEPALEWRQQWMRAATPFLLGEPTDPGLPGFRILRSSRWLPRLYRPRSLARAVEKLHYGRGPRWLREVGCERVLLYLWRPEFEPALDLLEYDASAYHIDDEYSFSPEERPVSPREVRVLRRVDRVFIHSRTLMEKKGHLNPHTIRLPNGVSYAAYTRPRPEPADLSRLPGPRIAYVGIIKPQLDLEVVRQVAEARPDWSLVMVGPVSPIDGIGGELDRIRVLENVHFLGQKDVSALPAYLQHVDVGVLPYRMNDYTKYIYPMKLHEYLAAGCPIVASPVPSLAGFGEVVEIAQSAPEWIEAIELALRPEATSPQRIAARRRVAAAHDWDSLVHRIARSLASTLGPGYRDRLGEHFPSDDSEVGEDRVSV